MKQVGSLCGCLLLAAAPLWADPYANPSPPAITNFTATGATRALQFDLVPAAAAYQVQAALAPTGPWGVDTNFLWSTRTNVSGSITSLVHDVRRTNAAGPAGFYRLEVPVLGSNALLAAQVLNRLAYGPTPDELERVTAMGAEAFIAEQLNMDGIPEPLDAYVTVATNSANIGDPATNWVQITVTGRMNQTNLFVFLTRPGTVFVDDIELFEGTNTSGPNLLTNGNFESALTPPWTVPANHAGTAITNGAGRNGGNALRLNAVAPGTNTTTGAVWCPFVTTLTNLATVTLRYWYLPTAGSSALNVGFFGTSGFLASAADLPPTPVWTYVTATGRASNASSQVFLFPSGAGEFYIDDVKLVAGTVPEAGPNLLTNGDFESGALSPWNATADFTNSVITDTLAREGARSLRIVATGGGRAITSDSIYQNVTLDTNLTYTLSYWYLNPTPATRTFTNMLSGGRLVTRPDQDSSGLRRRLEANAALLEDLRAWFTLNAVHSRRQLFEILTQFLENHFVTQHSKSTDYLGIYSDGNLRNRIATDWEWREITRWRNALLNPDCTFYDLLRISCESPAMIVYLDTVNSRGNGNNIANENFSREILELFTFGVDNGYDQNDIIAMSRAWTGWSVEIVDAENAANPFAPISRTYTPGIGSQNKTNLVGVWAFNYKAGNHGTNRAPLFSVWATNTTNLVATGPKTVPARFGAPWAGRNYQLVIPPRATGTTNSIQDGYDVIAHLADQPFTQEYISVKLCRLFVHDDFPNPTTNPDAPEYAFYDYTRPDLSDEARLVRDCMLAWENSTPKGRLRDVLAVIFNSALFRSHAGIGHKVKTPLEFVASSVRALHSTNSDGTATAQTDGYSFTTPLNRMGGMSLFNRGDPDGYPEGAAGWISAGTLVERLRFVQALNIAPGGSGRTDAGNCFVDPVALLKKKLPSGSWNNAGAVADYFLSILFPAEGAGNLGPLRLAAVNFLNDGSADSSPNTTPFATLAHTSANYDTRVRGMVAMLMTQPRFQDQ